MDKKRLSLLGVLFVLLVVLLVIFFRSGGGEKIEKPPETPPSEPELLPAEPQETKKVALFFLSEEDTLLHPEEREISTGSIMHEAKQVVEELIKGSTSGYVSPFPPEARLRELFITEEGIAYVDFSKEILEKHLSGSSAEISTIFSIVNSLTYNFKSIKKVFILIEGGEKETLGGHINLSQPFNPQYDLIAR